MKNSMAETVVRRPRVLVVELTMRYLAEAGWPGDILVTSGILSISRSSFVMGQALWQDGVCVGLCDTVLVNAVDGRAAPLPDDYRAALEQALMRAPHESASE